MTKVRQEDIKNLQKQINMIPLPTKSSQLSHAPSMETLLSKKLNESSNRVIQKSNTRLNMGSAQGNNNTQMNSFMRQDSIENLARYQTGNLNMFVGK
jgi:hypothetical protein